MRRALSVGAVLAALAGAAVVVAAQAGDPAPLRPVVAAPSASAAPAAPTVAPRPAMADATTVVARPVRLRIRSIGLTARVTGLDRNPDRTVEVPEDPDDTGWYRPGPLPGAAGSAVILGHVDSVAGPAVFARLAELRPGDRVEVDADDGSTATFRVVRLVTYPNDRFPADRVYAAPGRRHRLNLVTCGGRYDPEDGYQANLVVYTRLVV